MNTTDLKMLFCIPVCWSGGAQTLGLVWWRSFWKVPTFPEGSTSPSKDHFCVTVKPILSPPSNAGFKRMQESVRLGLFHFQISNVLDGVFALSASWEPACHTLKRQKWLSNMLQINVNYESSLDSLQLCLPPPPLNRNLRLLWVQCLNINIQQWYISDHNSVLLVGLRWCINFINSEGEQYIVFQTIADIH